MANALGYVTETKTGFEGALAMMNLSSPIRIEKNAEKAAEGQPDYRIFAGETATEIGGGWVRKAKGSGRDYISMVITTSRRAYYLELTAFRQTYMAAVSWRYPALSLPRREAVPAAARAPEALLGGLQPEQLRFRYEISGDSPHWRPEQVFDDGSKVYIRFPGRLDQGEAPPLFVVGQGGEGMLVNYRMRENYYVVDRLFTRAELRMGEDRQAVVRIARSDAGRSGR